MKHPPFLKPGDLIYICAPAKSIPQETLFSAKARLEEAGYLVEIAEHAAGQYHYFSGTIDERYEDLQKGLDDPKAKVIWCARGGYGCVHLLNRLDWTAFHENPKWLLGFSDITNLHLELAQVRHPSIHSTMPLNFAENTPESFQKTLDVLNGQCSALTFGLHEKNQFGKVRAEVLGGNMAIVYNLLSRFEKDLFKAKILFLEEVGENVYEIDRMLHAFAQKGLLDVISGLIVGGMTNIGDSEPGFGLTVEELFRGHLAHRRIPIAFGIQAGHIDNNYPIPFGVTCDLEVKAEGTSLKYDFHSTVA